MNLIVVLLLVVILSPLLAGVGYLARIDSAMTMSLRNALTTETISDGVLRYVVERIGAGDQRFLPSAGALERLIQVDGQSFHIAIEDEAGKVDLNAAPAPLIARAFSAIGVNGDSSAAVAAAIEAARDPYARPDSERGERVEVASGSRWARRPRGPLLAISEVHALEAVPASLGTNLRHAVTVHSGRAFVDPQLAPREVLLAVTEFDEDRVAAILRERQLVESGGGRGGAAVSEAVAARTLTVYLRVPGGADLQATRYAVIRVSPLTGRQVMVLEWGRLTQ